MADMKTGTTTVGLVYDGGIVLAADKRASMGHIIYEDDSPKIYQINSTVAVTNAGDVGDSLSIIRFLKSHAKLYEFERNEAMSSRAAATFLSNILNGNRYYPYIVQLIIAGFNGKPELFDLTPLGAVLERDKYAVSGSGTEPALATLDNEYKKGMNEKDAVNLAIKAVEAAKRRDMYSGGIGATVFIVDSKGVREIAADKVEKIVKGLSA